MYNISKELIEDGIKIIDLLAETTNVFPSKAELRRTVKGNGLSINKEKISDPELIIGKDFLIDGKYILVQKGKKNYSLIIAG
jgi:tyrosyl-tRNA synthetase